MLPSDEQVKLLYHDDYIYFVHVDGTDPKHPVWEFGSRITMESYLALQLMGSVNLQEAVDTYYQLVTNHLIPAWIYRSDVKGREYRVQSIHELVPIDPALMNSARAVDYDLRRAPVGVVDQLQEVIDRFKTSNRG